ncbi:hypothetical protein [Bosea sp. NBC_00550]|uniref:hypothetical protein n=1 Tax=Bosea sp. NBC_00550 TaxID=2969621 RepID=UPI00222EBE59|nr:hypothetical protein [Bosea sp. NBC_00550]UZF92947.1 hypothetical protein NWE53_01630 [Bosea sp. NBC_00550]
MNDEVGNIVVEIGAFVIAEHPVFAAQVGVLAGEWAHAEAELSVYLASLMHTSPERTFALLAAYNNATSTTKAAINLAKVTLSGDPLANFETIVARFRKLAERRNDIQHGIWARKPAQNSNLFRVKPVEYTKFMIAVSHSKDLISEANQFASQLDDEYSVEALETISKDIRQLTADLCAARFDWLNSGVRAKTVHGKF